MWISVLKQMWNRKRSNSWIAVELLPVFCLTWYIVDFLFVLAYNYNIPNHRNVENTLQINLSEFDENHPEYKAEAHEPEILEADFSRILQALRNYPGIESVGVSFDGSTPGGGSYWGRGFRSAKDTTRSAGGQCITIAPEEDYFKVFGLSTDNGRKMISTKDFEWAPNGVILSRSVANILFPGESAFGQELNGWSEEKFTVIGVIDDNKRFDFHRPQNYFYLPRRINAENLKGAEISIRYHSSLSDAKFREQFNADMTNSLRIGNFYLLSIIPYTKIGQDTTMIFGIGNDIRIRIYLMIFFLLCIFLCIMGAFWYRISLRPNEIGLRKALGATRINIHYSLIMEGIWLLLIIVLPAMLIEYQFVHAGLIETLGRNGDPNPEYLPDRTFIRFLITNAFTFVSILIVIVSAIWLPARKGASLAPAEALHYE
ncbi:MAG: ABC transporter permease [Tannerella sp.]|jgi:putative ABC transport system permease protein|nr:ABC transporter permease [Tannerella sp.]